MKAVSTRKLTIVDTMMFVASTAVGFAVLRAFATSGWFFRQEFAFSRISVIAQCANEVCFPFLASWTFCFLILRLRRPRPQLRRLARQPGMAAGTAAGVVLFVPLMAILIPEIYRSLEGIQPMTTLLQAVGFSSQSQEPVVLYGLPQVKSPAINWGPKAQPVTTGSSGSFGVGALV
jgi:hypothetical protein